MSTRTVYVILVLKCQLEAKWTFILEACQTACQRALRAGTVILVDISSHRKESILSQAEAVAAPESGAANVCNQGWGNGVPYFDDWSAKQFHQSRWEGRRGWGEENPVKRESD
ncbi:hypothetical protein J6590_029246 [Homalodisca vitripennis]|nr:hypothetical protein J6590_029246 [Homalodisca vitripennis]